MAHYDYEPIQAGWIAAYRLAGTLHYKAPDQLPTPQAPDSRPPGDSAWPIIVIFWRA